MYPIFDIQNGLLLWIDKHFYNLKQSDDIYKKLIKEITYDEQSSVVIFGKTIQIPRKQSAYGNPGIKYSFSGIQVTSKPWLPILLKIKEDIEFLTDQKFNFCLVNYYENGTQYIGYHKDDERELGDSPSIVSLSFGQERKFYFKSDNKKLPIIKLSLNHGCLCWMINPTNKYWKHSVPKELKVMGARINLTFRWINN